MRFELGRYLARGFKNDDVEWKCSKVLSLSKGLRSILMKRLGYSVEKLGRFSTMKSKLVF